MKDEPVNLQAELLKLHREACVNVLMGVAIGTLFTAAFGDPGSLRFVDAIVALAAISLWVDTGLKPLIEKIAAVRKLL